MKNLIRDVMTKDLTTILWSDSLEIAEKKMQVGHIRHLPVVDEDGQLVGLISDRDIQRGRSSFTDFARSDFTPLVRDFMSSPVEKVKSTTELKEVAHRMIAFKISAFVVVDSEQLVGIVTSNDLLHILISFLDEQPPEPQSDSLSYYSPIGEVANFFSQAGI